MKSNCQICNSTENNGINLLGLYLCRECLSEISKTEVEDIRYEYYKSVIKKIWLDYIIEYC
ncbi:MAG: sigma factor G inhibitor Gin [Tissierellales bacterium]